MLKVKAPSSAPGGMVSAASPPGRRTVPPRAPMVCTLGAAGASGGPPSRETCGVEELPQAAARRRTATVGRIVIGCDCTPIPNIDGAPGDPPPPHPALPRRPLPVGERFEL